MNVYDILQHYHPALLILSILSVTLFAGVFLVSKKFALSLSATLRFFIRAFLLWAIKLALKCYDPSKTYAECPTGPQADNPGRNSSRDEFEQTMKTLYSGSNVVVSTFRNTPLLRSPYQFGYQPITDQNLLKLRDKYDLMRFSPADVNDFKAITDLAAWVSCQLEHGKSGKHLFDPRNFDADRVLCYAKRGYQFWCHVYSMTFVQLAASLGIQGRVVSLTRDGYQSPDMHAAVEIWCNQFAKWFVIDVDFNIWYQRNGIPLNVLEIHDALVTDQTDTINIVQGTKRPLHIDQENRIPILYQYYRYFYIDMRNDWLSNRYFPGHPQCSDSATLFWVDRRLRPVLNVMRKTWTTSDLYWDINRVHVSCIPMNIHPHTLRVQLDTLTPNFSHFEITFDDAFATTEKTAFVDWKLHEGKNSIHIQSVTLNGMRGLQSRIDVMIH